jgi:hypothetical protein
MSGPSASFAQRIERDLAHVLRGAQRMRPLMSGQITQARQFALELGLDIKLRPCIVVMIFRAD